MSFSAHFKRVLRYIRRASREGASLLRAGGRSRHAFEVRYCTSTAITLAITTTQTN